MAGGVRAAEVGGADTNDGKQAGGGVLIELCVNVRVMLMSKRSADQPFERGCGGSADELPRSPLDVRWVETGLGRCRFHLGQRQPVR